VVSKDDNFTVVTTGEANIGLRLRHFPIPLTFAIFDEYGSLHTFFSVFIVIIVIMV
jgi:hypothetical protein